MKKMFGIWVVVVFGFIFILSACGEQSQEDVVEKLESNLESMNGYKARAEMTMNTGQEDQKYSIDVWHKKKDFYRVELSNNQDEEGSQIILKNEDGVFVLSPALNKSFKFQEEWPENGSQPYLYQSLVNDILKDNEAEFDISEDHYIFETKTNYQSNNNLPYQEVYFDKKSYTPVMVKVLDKDRNALVQVNFSEYNTDPTFEDDDFTMEKNMNSESADTSVSSDAEAETDTFSVVYPQNMKGSELVEETQLDTANGERVIMTFSGDKSFTLVEEKQEVVQTLSSPQMVDGEIVNLGHAIGALSDNTIEWTNNGMNFILASEELTREELIEVAQSVQGKEVK
ncbi:Outer membrane lipoprotein-sorting protein [Lentibacillus halodurans]|uniref:Outer membrane lipoprotein-sorting protein n=1 Tax=Lentibacillus halodurans TaxID=237679 RepID=A0A1I1AMU9_9BACI|nr:outer membrane lipoprotein carrier protein LolA [Lentibacillus halodurans]SFB38842.1 Outer membrane lipoprotein-sorting protein [Lentibacillus halodurans]